MVELRSSVEIDQERGLFTSFDSIASIRLESFSVRSEVDVVNVRHTVRAWSAELKFSLIDQTKLVTAASELARNTIVHGGGGIMHIEVVNRRGKYGLRMTFEDEGPGIADIDQALKDGFTTGGGLGLGLGGSKRLVNEFEVHSQVGKGTRIVAIRWK